MNKKEIKAIWKLTYSIWKISVIFWLLETILFLIIEGWHVKATNKIEIYCDNIVTQMWEYASFLTIFVCVMILINFKKKINYEK